MLRTFSYVALILGIPAVMLMALAVFGPPSWFAVDPSSESEVTLHVGYLAGAITVIAIGVAIAAIFAQRQTARAHATLTHLTTMEFDEDFLRAKKMFLELEAKGDLQKYGNRKLAHTDEARLIRIYLNHFEMVSLGLQHRIIDYDIFIKWNRKTVLLVWTAASPFVNRLRKEFHNDMLFIEFEELAKEFGGSKRRRFR
jgi:hypothetical protein